MKRCRVKNILLKSILFFSLFFPISLYAQSIDAVVVSDTDELIIYENQERFLDDDVIIEWKTNKKATAFVEYEDKDGNKYEKENDDVSFEHAIVLESVSAKYPITYKIISSTATEHQQLGPFSVDSKNENLSIKENNFLKSHVVDRIIVLALIGFIIFFLIMVVKKRRT